MEKKKKMNRKAGIPDGIFYLIAIFAVSIIFLVGYVIMDDINTAFSDNDAISSTGKDIVSDIKGKYVGIVDNAFLMIIIGLLIGTGVGVWFIRVHPALFWITIPLLAFIIFLSAIYANVFYNIETNDKLSAAAAEFTVVPFVMENYPYIITVAIILIAILLFAKGKPTDVL